VPGASHIWKLIDAAQEVLRQYVFFEPTWRGAVTWADAASRRSKGRKGSLARSPVVIRVPKRGLDTQYDPFARREGCLMVKGSVYASEAHFIVRPTLGFPTWYSLTKAGISKISKNLPQHC
jgi:hypothetical protein